MCNFYSAVKNTKFTQIFNNQETYVIKTILGSAMANDISVRVAIRIRPMLPHESSIGCQPCIKEVRLLVQTLALALMFGITAKH